MGKVASIVVKVTVGPFVNGKRRTLEWSAPLVKVAGKNASNLAREFARLHNESARLIREGLGGDMADEPDVVDVDPGAADGTDTDGSGLVVWGGDE